MEDRALEEETRVAWRADLLRWWPVGLIPVELVAIRIEALHWLGAWLWAPAMAGLGVSLFHFRTRLSATPASLLLAGFVAYSVVSLLWSPQRDRGFRLVVLVAVALLAQVYGRALGPPRGDSRLWLVGFLGLAVTVIGAALVRQPQPFQQLNPDRILAMGGVAMVVAAWYGPRSRGYTLGVGLLGLAVVLASGSRTATLVAAVLLVTAPRLRIPKTGRLLLAGCLVAVGVVWSLTPQFQERWFQSGEGTWWDLVTLHDVNTSGRAEVWPVVAASCTRPLLGDGAGASDSYGVAANKGFPEPHNEYLRLWCDTGLIGTVLFWGFVATTSIKALAGTRAVRRPWEHTSALQMALALLVLSLTDNPLTTAVPFLIPVALVFGWSDATGPVRVPALGAAKVPGFIRPTRP